MTVAEIVNNTQHITLCAGDLELSGLLGMPSGPPRATIVALHGVGMTGAYFDSRLLPGQSMIELATWMGYNIICIDRPGYGISSGKVGDGQRIEEQARTISTAVRNLRDHFDIGAGVVLAAHSFGGKVALSIAAREMIPGLLGIELSGCGYRFAAGNQLRNASVQRNWGPLRLYPPGTFTVAKGILADVPVRELTEASEWSNRLPALAATVQIPVRMTFAEFEGWWKHDEAAIGELRQLLTGSPRVQIERQLRAGHNISLGWSARAYHLKMMAFVEECTTT